MDEPQYTHALSQKSIDLGRDIFIFSYDKERVSEELLLGLNHAVTGASPATLLRWLRRFSPELGDLQLRRAHMLRSKAAPLAVRVDENRIGNPVAPNEILTAGQYIWTGSMCDTPSELSFAKLRARYANDTLVKLAVGDAIKLYEISNEQRKHVLHRHNDICFMTGQHVPVDVCWIFPPTWGYMIEKGTSPETFNRQYYITEDNMVPMQKELVEEFHDNAFGIDVDDAYRIVKFRPMKSPVTLPDHLPTHSDINYSHFDSFLRLHFDWCIQVNVFGGDPFTEHESELGPLMNRLGVHLGTDTRDYESRKEHKDWLTVPGQAILELLVMKKKIKEEEVATYGPPKLE